MTKTPGENNIEDPFWEEDRRKKEAGAMKVVRQQTSFCQRMPSLGFFLNIACKFKHNNPEVENFHGFLLNKPACSLAPQGIKLQSWFLSGFHLRTSGGCTLQVPRAICRTLGR